MSWNNVTPAWALDKGKPVKYAVLIEIDTGEWEYIRETNPFSNSTPVLLFDNKDLAEEECKKWITGHVIEWQEIRWQELREMTSEERQRAKERDKWNGWSEVPIDVHR